MFSEFMVRGTIFSYSSQLAKGYILPPSSIVIALEAQIAVCIDRLKLGVCFVFAVNSIQFVLFEIVG